PGIGQAGDGGGMADAGRVVDVVGAPERRQFAVEIGVLVGEFGGAQPVDGVRPRFLPDRCNLVADLVDGVVPADAGPLALDELHWIAHPAVPVHDLARGRAFRTMRAAIDRRLPCRLLADPYAVGDLRGHRATDRAECAYALADGDGRAGLDRRA